MKEGEEKMKTEGNKEGAALKKRREVVETITQLRKNLLVPEHERGLKSEESDDLEKKLMKYYRLYEELLPTQTLSRCPFSGEKVNMAIDTMGLDGYWWNYDDPVRPDKNFPETVFAFTGAVGIKEKIPVTPFLCKPGPGIPFVVPRLLVEPNVKAVISSIEIDGMQAWPIFYFAQPTPYDIVRINDWGQDYYVAEHENGEGYVMQTRDYYIDYDFDLEFYIRRGSLLWIKPNDPSFLLRSTVEDCPYLGLEGRNYPVALYGGKIWNSLIDAEALESENEINGKGVNNEK
jgi:hypothetical protein